MYEPAGTSGIVYDPSAAVWAVTPATGAPTGSLSSTVAPSTGSALSARVMWPEMLPGPASAAPGSATAHTIVTAARMTPQARLRRVGRPASISVCGSGD